MNVKKVMALGALAAAEDLDSRIVPSHLSVETRTVVKEVIDRVRWFAKELES